MKDIEKMDNKIKNISLSILYLSIGILLTMISYTLFTGIDIVSKNLEQESIAKIKIIERVDEIAETSIKAINNISNNIEKESLSRVEFMDRTQKRIDNTSLMMENLGMYLVGYGMFTEYRSDIEMTNSSINIMKNAIKKSEEGGLDSIATIMQLVLDSTIKTSR